MASASTDDWTEEKCLQLIREFRARSILWDAKDPFFFNKRMKLMAWQEIGTVLNINSAQCKYKMTILMSSFRREKAKIMHSIRKLSGDTEPSQVHKSSWFGFKDMAFLLDKDTERKRQLHDSDEIDEDDDSTSSSAKLCHSHDALLQPRKKRKSYVAIMKDFANKINAKEREEIVRQVVHQPIPSPSQTIEERNEEIQSFTLFIGNKMKRYNDATKNDVQQAICEIIFKADHNCFENSYETLSIIDDEPVPLNEQEKMLIKIQNESDIE